MKRKLFAFLIIIFCFETHAQQCISTGDCSNLSNSCSFTANANQADSLALISFNSPGFTPGWTGVGWNVLAPMRDWDGVCIDEEGYVIEINLSARGLAGPLPAIFADLNRLNKLDLSNNGITTNVQSLVNIGQAGNGTSLIYLDLSNNSFNEPISYLPNISSILKYVDLSNNSFTGTLPNSISGLTQLCYLDLSNNSLDGPIPSTIGQNTSLVYLNLSFNAGFEGSSIPTGIGDLSDLQVLDLSNSNLGGTIPPSIGGLQDLVCLNLSFNNLIGNIPSELNDLGLFSLQSLYLQVNDLSGCVDSLGALCNTEYSLDQTNTSISTAIFDDFCLTGTSNCCPSLTPAPGPDTAVCEGVTLTLLSGGPSADIYWITPNNDTVYSTNLTIAPVTTNDFGTYKIEATGNNCFVEDSVIVNSFPNTTASFDATADPNNNLQYTFTNTSTNGNTYIWDLGDGTTSTETNLIHTYADDGSYEVCLTTTGICNEETTCETISTGIPAPIMMPVPLGTFTLGCETPPCNNQNEIYGEVKIDSFYLGQTEVTQLLYNVVMGNNPSRFSNCLPCPVDSVSWFDAILFCNHLTTQLLSSADVCYFSDANLNTPYSGGTEVWWNTEAKGFRLPTEAEWEHAAKDGALVGITLNYSGNNDPTVVAWFADNSGGETHQVASLQANAVDIYDMTGNVAEWCWGNYGEDDYDNFPPCNPLGNLISNENRRVVRGGSWNSQVGGGDLTIFNRSSFDQSMKSDKIGFRVARNANN